MTNWMRAATLGLALSLSGVSQAQMSESLKSEFHKEEELGAVIVGKDEKSMLGQILANPATRIISLQLLQEDFDPGMVPALMQWVQAGHSLWIYDARLASHFGFLPLMMKKNQFTNKPESGKLGGVKLDGVGTTGLAMGGHPVDTGVGQVSLFLPKVGDEEYGAVNVTADTVPLLRFTITSPAVAALRRDGRGLVVFKPLLWPEPLSGERFQSNLLEFSAGFQVPGPAGQGKVGRPPGPEAEFVKGNPAPPVGNVTVPEPGKNPPEQVKNPPEPGKNPPEQVKNPPDPSREPVVASPINPDNADEMEVVGEGVLLGLIVTEKLRFETGTSTVQLTRLEVESIELKQGGQLDVVHWRDGRLTKGFLMDKSVEIEVNGDTRKIEKKLLRRLRWGKASVS